MDTFSAGENCSIVLSQESIKVEPLVKLAKYMVANGLTNLFVGFANTMGSYNAVINAMPKLKGINATFYVVLFRKGRDSETSLTENIASAEQINSINKSLRTRHRLITANAWLNGEFASANYRDLTNPSARPVTLHSENDKLRTSNYRDFMQLYANNLMSLNRITNYHAIEFGFDDAIFIKFYAEHIRAIFAQNESLIRSMRHLFMVIGSGTTLIALYRALEVMGLETQITIHATIVGRKPNTDYIGANIGDDAIKRVIFSNVTMAYTDAYVLPLEYRCWMGETNVNIPISTNDLVELASIHPCYDSKLLTGVIEHLNNYALKDCCFFFVAKK